MTHPGLPYTLPRSPDEFQRLCLKLLRRHWQLPGLERLHDPAGRELGLDLLEVSGSPRLSAVRCELRPLGEPPSGAEIRQAVDRVMGLGLPLGRFVIAVTSWGSRAVRSAMSELNRAHRAAGRFFVQVLCWEEMEDLLDEYPGVLTEFASVAKRQALSRAEARTRLEPLWPEAAAASGAGDEVMEQLAAAASCIERRDYQMARLKLMQLRERSWSTMDPERRLGLLTALAVAWLREGDRRKAAMLMIAACSLKPEDETARTNEVLAYELLGEHQRACSLAEGLCRSSPANAQAHALWLNNLPLESATAELETRLSGEVAGDPVVAMVIARRAIAVGDYARAEQFARKASEAAGENSDAWLALGQSILLCEVETSATAVEERVKEAQACFSRAIALAREKESVDNEVQALIGRAQARIAARDLEGASEDIENARALEREDANGLCEYGILLRSRGNFASAVEVFRRAVRLGGREDGEYQLALALAGRELPGDLQEAASLLASAVKNPRSIPRGEYLFALAYTIETLARLERWHEGEELLAGPAAQQIPQCALLTLRGTLELSRGNPSEACALAKEALAAVKAESGLDELRKLAALMHDLGSYREALELWQSVAEHGGSTADMRHVLGCARRLGRDDIVLGLCRRLRGEGRLPEAAIEFELEVLERSDPEAALRVVEDYLATHPGQRVMRLRRSMLARKLGRNELVAADADAIPAASEVLPALGRTAVQLMREPGRASEALAYAYELLRKNPADPDAHRAFLCALGPLGPMPAVPEFETAQAGCAVLFAEQESKIERWAILEDGPDADESADEYGPAHPLARQLRGRRPGDKFQLPETRFSRKTAIVKRVISKYAYRYQDCLARWETRFPGSPEIEMVQSPPQTAAWNELAPDPNPEAPARGAGEEAVAKAEQAYARAPLPIHAFAERLGISDFHAIFTLASRPEAIIRCCEGSQDELDVALAAFGRSNSIVLDLTAIATLSLLGLLKSLRPWPRQFVVAQATHHELRRLQVDDRAMRLALESSNPSDRDASTSQSAATRPRALADLVHSICSVGDGTVLSTLAPERRDKLVRCFGRAGAESIVLGSMPGHVLWSDDGVLAAIARSEFGVRRVWTQAALMAQARLGSLGSAELALAGTKLAGWGFSFTTPSIETLMRAGSVAGWSPDRFPLRQMLDQFATQSVKLSDAVILAAELIVKLHSDVYLRSMRAAVTARLLDRLAARPGGREAIDALPKSLPIRFGLDLIQARELADALRGWMAKHAEDIAA